MGSGRTHQRLTRNHHGSWNEESVYERAQLACQLHRGLGDYAAGTLLFNLAPPTVLLC